MYLYLYVNTGQLLLLVGLALFSAKYELTGKEAKNYNYSHSRCDVSDLYFLSSPIMSTRSGLKRYIRTLHPASLAANSLFAPQNYMPIILIVHTHDQQDKVCYRRK